MDRHQVVTVAADIPIDDLLALYRTAWWAVDRQRRDVEVMLAQSDVVVGLLEGDRLVAFTRVLTDGTYLAFVLDVIVAEDRRGHGLGARLLDRVLADDRLTAVHSIELVCQPDLVPFYERWGFTTQLGGSLAMRRSVAGR